MRSSLEFGRSILHYSQFSSRLRLPNPFLQFFNRVGEDKVKPVFYKANLKVKVKVEELDVRNNE